jgi:hypothetical protein
MGEFLDILIPVIVVLGLFSPLLFLFGGLAKKEKELEEADKDKYVSPARDISDIDNYEPEETEMRAKVIHMACGSRLVGTKEPKSIQSFIVKFEDDYENEIELSVTEDYYNALDVGQVGILTLRDGDFYSFELDENTDEEE